MALTELQLPTKAQFYSNVQSAATNIDGLMATYKKMAEFLAKMDTSDLDAMGIAAGQVRTDLVDFRVAVNEIIALYNGTATTPTKNPATVMAAIRRMS